MLFQFLFPCRYLVQQLEDGYVLHQTLTTLQTTIQDLIQIKPQDFEKPSAQAIKDVINDKYSNKIIPNIGLCLCMWDLLSASEGLIGHGTGLVNVNGALADWRHPPWAHMYSRVPHGRLPAFSW